MNTWKTDVTDGLIDDIIEEVKARMDKIQGQSCGCRRKPKVLVLGELEQAEENILKSFAEICTSLEEGNCDFVVAAQVSAGLLAFTALGIPGQPEAQRILEAMLNGKKVYFLEKVWNTGDTGSLPTRRYSRNTRSMRRRSGASAERSSPVYRRQQNLKCGPGKRNARQKRTVRPLI